MSTAETLEVTLGGEIYKAPPVTFCRAAKILPLVNPSFEGLRSNQLTEDMILNLGRMVYHGIDHGDMTEEQFLQKHISYREMVAAAFVVAAQANMRKDEPPGEAQGGEAPQTSTN